MAIETIVYNTQGTCSKQIILQVEDDIVKNAEFIGGCQGNLTGISSLIIGMNIMPIWWACLAISIPAVVIAASIFIIKVKETKGANLEEIR